MPKFYKLVESTDKECDGEPHIAVGNRREMIDHLENQNLDFCSTSTHGSIMVCNLFMVRDDMIKSELKENPRMGMLPKE